MPPTNHLREEHECLDPDPRYQKSNEGSTNHKHPYIGHKRCDSSQNENTNETRKENSFSSEIVRNISEDYSTETPTDEEDRWRHVIDPVSIATQVVPEKWGMVEIYSRIYFVVDCLLFIREQKNQN